jgi:hypothetical protein
MDRSTVAVALIGVALAGVGGWQTLQSANLQADIDALQKSQQNWDKERKDQAVQYDKTITSLRQQLQNEQQQLELARARPPEPVPAQPKALAPAVAATNKAAATPSATNQLPTGVAITTGIVTSIEDMSPERQQALAASMYASQYGGFISTLKLAPAAEAALKQRLIDLQVRQFNLSSKVKSGEVNGQEAAKSFREEANRILSDYLSPDQLTAYADYQKQAPARAKETLAKSFAMTLQLGVPALSEQSRAVVSSLYTEIATRPFSPKDGLTVMDRMNQNYDEVVTKLQGKIPDEEVKLIKDYFKYQRRISEAVNQGR